MLQQTMDKSRDGVYVIQINTNGIQNAPSKEQEEIDETESVEGKSSYFHTLVNLYRGTVGTGVLALPYAFNNSGYIGGILGIIAVTSLVTYCSLLLARSSLELSSRRKTGLLKTYEATVKAAFEEGPKRFRPYSPWAQNTANFFLILGQFGTVCVYIIFVAQNMKEALESEIGEYSIRVYMLWITLPVLAMNICLTLKRLSFISNSGNLILLISILCVMNYAIRDMEFIKEAKPFAPIIQLPAFIGTMFFASGGAYLVAPLQNEMKKPEQLSTTYGVLNVNAFISAILYCIFGITGYLNYGPNAKESVTLNLPSQDSLSKLIQLFLALSTMTATGVQNYVTVSALWEDYLVKIVTKRKMLVKLLIRVGTITLAVGTALIMPNLGMVMSLVGILSQSTVGTTFNCVIYMLVYWEHPNFYRRICTQIVIIIIIMCICIYALISEINSFLQS